MFFESKQGWTLKSFSGVNDSTDNAALNESVEGLNIPDFTIDKQFCGTKRTNG